MYTRTGRTHQIHLPLLRHFRKVFLMPFYYIYTIFCLSILFFFLLLLRPIGLFYGWEITPTKKMYDDDNNKKGIKGNILIEIKTERESRKYSWIEKATKTKGKKWIFVILL